MSDLPTLNVSRETSERLDIHARLLRKWTTSINLVARSTLDELWSRHFLDSAQLYRLAPHPVKHWADFGSGGGFPGLVIAILGMESASPARITLVESDTRKCAFLRNVIRETGAPVSVVNERIEKVEPLNADVISARALADLDKLLCFSERHLAPSGCALFPKGRSWREEVAKAETAWQFRYQVARSEVEPEAVILSVTGASRV